MFAVSKAGRDKGLLFVVLELTDNGYAMIADGRHRKVTKPKKKKLKHLEVLERHDEELAKIIADGKLTNKLAWKAVREQNENIVFRRDYSAKD